MLPILGLALQKTPHNSHKNHIHHSNPHSNSHHLNPNPNMLTTSKGYLSQTAGVLNPTKPHLHNNTNSHPVKTTKDETALVVPVA
jgi:hypothetical protein